MDLALKLRFAGLLALLALLLGSCLTPTQEKPAPGPGDAPWFHIYFSRPSSPQAEELRGGPDQVLALAIRQARLGVDVAAYDLNLWSIRDALVEVHRRGIRVRLVTDSDSLKGLEIQELKEAGIPILGDRREGLMHNKFVVIDGREVWSGSLNLTLNSAYRNNDNLIQVRSPELAENYTTEFEEMFLDDLFGPGSPENTPHPSLVIEGSWVETRFSPDDGVAERLLELLGSAQESIDILAYSFTSDDLGDVLIERSQAGVQVSGVFESSHVKSNVGGEFERLHAAGLDVRMDGNPHNMHHKVIIIDGKIVITGSYNFGRNAETQNDENVLVIHNPQVAGIYLEEFERLFQEAALP